MCLFGTKGLWDLTGKSTCALVGGGFGMLWIHSKLQIDRGSGVWGDGS